MNIDCSCGCNGDRSKPGCTFTGVGIGSNEYLCSAGNATTITELTKYWQVINCPAIYESVLYTGPTGQLAYNKCYLAQIQADIDHLATTYLKMGYDFTATTTSPKYNPFQENILKLCSNPLVPGACDLFLQNYCANKTREQIGNDDALTGLCGCYAPPLYPTRTIPVRCDPLCHLVQTTQRSDPCTGTISRCSNTVCVIDDVNIKIVGGNGGSVPVFQQICPGCDASGSDPCTCIIGGSNLVNTLNNSGVGPEYTVFCGQNAQCFQESPQGMLTAVPCPTANDFNFPVPAYTYPLMIALVVVFITVVIVLAIYASRGK